MDKQRQCYVLCSAERNGKIVDLSIEPYDYSAVKYKSRWEKRGCNVSRLILPHIKLSNSFTESTDSKKAFIPNGDWAKTVLCVETGKMYRTIRDCMKDTEIGGFRMRNALYKGYEVEGMHFRIVEDGQRL